MRTRIRLSAPVAPETAFRAGIWIVFAILCVPHASARAMPHPHRQPKQVVHIIECLEQQWQNAELNANTTVIANMLSPDYLGIGADGTLFTKAQTIAAMKRGSLHFNEINTSDRKIRVFGTTVVVVSKADVVGVSSGENISGRYRYTRVYHRLNGVWKIVSFEASTLHEHATGIRPGASALSGRPAGKR